MHLLQGSQSSAMYGKGSFLERAAISTLPFAIDDPPMAKSGSSLDINDLIIDTYNGCKTANLRKGSLQPFSVPIIGTNFDLKQHQRYGYVGKQRNHISICSIVVDVHCIYVYHFPHPYLNEVNRASRGTIRQMTAHAHVAPECTTWAQWQAHAH